MKKIILALLSVFSSMTLSAHIGGELNRPDRAVESIYKVATFSPDEFQVDTLRLSGGYKAIRVEHKCFAYTAYQLTYDAQSRLVGVSSGCSESVALHTYKLNYNANQTLSEVIFTGAYEDVENAEGLKQSISKSSPDWTYYKIERNANGKAIRVGGVDVPDGYEAHYALKEAPHFWSSDLRGGSIYFFLAVVPMDKQANHVHAKYYVNSQLALDCEYAEGKLVKAISYNEKGDRVNAYKSPKFDVDKILANDWFY